MKDKFYDTLIGLLNGYHFIKVNDNHYKLESVREQPGGYININGRMMQSPSSRFTTIHEVIIINDGWCADMDESNKREFSQIKFKITQNDQELLDLDSCIYYDDIDELNNMFNKFIQS